MLCTAYPLETINQLQADLQYKHIAMLLILHVATRTGGNRRILRFLQQLICLVLDPDDGFVMC